MPVRRLDINSLLPALARNATVLTPNFRISDALLDSHAGSVESEVFVTPQITPVDIWIQELWDLWAHSGRMPFARWQLLSPVQEHFIWLTSVQQSLSDYPLLNPEETARAVSQSYRDLRQWLPDKSTERLQQHASTPDSLAFLHWVQAYQQSCQQQQCLSLVDAIGELLRLSAQDWANLPALPKELCLVNFFAIPPLYEQLFTRLSQLAELTQHQIPEIKPNPKSFSEHPNTIRYEYDDQVSEITACAKWAHQTRSDNPEAHIGIIYSEDILAEPATRHLLNAVLDETRALTARQGDANYNSSGSRQTLLDTGIISDALLLLNLNDTQQSCVDLERLLLSPYIHGEDVEREARLKMVTLLHRRFSATTTLNDFSWYLQQTDRSTYAPLLASALLAANSRLRAFPATATTQEWAVGFSLLLSDFGWPGEACSQADINILTCWQHTLREFASAGSLQARLSITGALTHLRRLCGQKSLPINFQPNNPLSVYSVAEAVGMQFDYIWLPGFSSQSWPASAQPSAFIPYSLQREAQIPGSHSDLQYQQAHSQFTILCASVSKHIIASHHTTDGELQFSPSSFISEWPVQKSPSIFTASNDNKAIAIEVITDPATHPLQDKETVRGGQSIISNQSSCPFRAFAAHRLQVQALSPFEAGLTMRDRGSALHVALELLFADIDSLSTLQALSNDERDELVAKASAQAIQFLSKRQRNLMTPRFRQLEQQRVTTLLLRFLELETSRSDFTVLAREQALEWQHGNLQLNLKIDRVDGLSDGSLALIDYKTGKQVTSAQKWIEQRPEDMQLPLYYTVATEQQEKAITALAIAHVNVENMAYSGLVASSNMHTSLTPVAENRRIAMEWSAVTAQWQTNVRMRAEEFIAGQAQVAPVNGRLTCQYCGLDALCRIQELDMTPDDGDTPETEP